MVEPHNGKCTVGLEYYMIWRRIQGYLLIQRPGLGPANTSVGQDNEGKTVIYALVFHWNSLWIKLGES